MTFFFHRIESPNSYSRIFIRSYRYGISRSTVYRWNNICQSIISANTKRYRFSADKRFRPNSITNIESRLLGMSDVYSLKIPSKFYFDHIAHFIDITLSPSSTHSRWYESHHESGR